MRITVAAAAAFLVLPLGARAHAAPQRLEHAYYADPTVALGSSGRAVSLLSDGFQSRLVIRLARPGRRFGRPRVVPASVSRPGRALPVAISATVGASGRAVLLWTADDESQVAAVLQQGTVQPAGRTATFVR